MRRSVKNILRAGALCLILLACALFTTALAAEGDVTYVKYSWYELTNTLTSTTETLESGYTPVESSQTEWNAGWYVASGNVTIGTEDDPQRVTVQGDVHLILADGCKLTVAGITVNSGNSLTIYGQNAGSGKLISVENSLGGAGIGGKYGAGSTADNHSGDITIHGGDITAIGSHGAGIGGAMSRGNSGTISIYNGTVTAEGHGGAAIGSGNMGTCGNVYIYGGNVKATSDTERLPGIGSGKNTSGNIHIYGGTVTASNGGSYGIDVGSQSSTANLITGDKGRAVIFTNGIRAANFLPGDDSNPQTGVIFIGSEGKVYGDVTLGNDLSIPTNYTLTVPASSALTIPDNRTLTVTSGATLEVQGGVTLEATGKLIVAEGGTLVYYSGAGIDLSNVDFTGGSLTFPEMGTGTGTADDPYTISTAAGLRALAELVDSGYDFAGMTIELADDIDLGGESKPWNPIGSHGGGNTKPFNGVFDGGGHTISGLYINDSNMSAAGLFAYIGENGNVQNLAVSGTVNAKANSGGIAAYNHGTISNCYADVDVTVENSFAGGIAGTSAGTVENCYNLGSIQGKGSVAGIVGSFTGSGERAKIENCYNIGNAAAQNSNIGAILGNNNSISNPNVSNCFYLESCVSNGNSYGESLTAGQFADSNSFGGWDFNNTWVMSVELGRPVLRSVPESAGFEIDFEKEEAKALGSYEISADGNKWVGGVTGIEIIPGETIYVREGYGAEEDAIPLPARPDAPALAINSATQSVTVDIGLEYSFDQTEWTSGTGEAVPVDAGDTIYIRYKASQEDGKFSSAIQTLTAPGNAPAAETPEIDYINETVGTGAGMQYSFSETGPWTACTADMPASSFGWDGTAPVTVYFRADPGDNYPGEPVELTIPARPAAPAVEGGAGRIAGADKSMEYSTDGGANWTPFTDETLGRMEPGEYQVRYAATESSFRSEAAAVTVAPGGQDVNVPETYGIELIAGDGGEAKTSLSNASAGTKITVTVTPDEGYELAYITVDGERISGASFTMPDHDVTVRVYFSGGALPFEDTPDGAWYYDAVSYVYAHGLMDGTSDTEFAPDANMTRAMLVTILWRMEGEPVVNYLLPFTDVPADSWYTEAVRWAASEGIVTGVSATEFAPNDEITREQLAAMLHRYAGEPATAATLAGFTDAASVSAYADEAMSWCVEQGIITGTTATTLAPQGAATRAQCATMLMRFMER